MAESIKVFRSEEGGTTHLRLEMYLHATCVGHAIVVSHVIQDLRVARLRMLYTSPGFRGRGYARMLVDRVEREVSADVLTLLAFPCEDRPLELQELFEMYERWGFTQNDPDNDVDFRMTKELG